MAIEKPRFYSRTNLPPSVGFTPKGESLTEQSHKDQCDINKIIDRFKTTGSLRHVNAMDGVFDEKLELTGLDYKQAVDIAMNAEKAFGKLPSGIRNRFDNDPGKLLDFVNNPENIEEGRELGLIAPAPSAPAPAPQEPVPAPQEPSPASNPE